MVKQFQLRIDPELHSKIKFFADLQGSTMTQLAVQALELYTRRLARLQEGRLTETLERIRQYSKDSSHLDKDLEAFVKAELELDDPLKAQPAPPKRPPASDQRDEKNPVADQVLSNFAELGR